MRRLLLAGLMILAFAPSANAVLDSISFGPVSLQVDGTCSITNPPTQFRSDITADQTGGQLYRVGILDANNIPLVVFGFTTDLTNATTDFPVVQIPPFLVNPTAGPFRLFGTNDTVPTNGTPFTGTIVGSRTFDANALDSDCPANLTPPAFSKVFAPDAIAPAGVSTLTFTIDNTANGFNVSSLDFTDTFPAAVTIATPPNASTTCTGGTITAVAGAGVFSYTDGTVNTGATCTVQVDVTSTTPGAHVNTSGNLTSTAGDSGTAADTLTVNAIAPGFAKAFAPDSIVAGGVSTLTFTIDNTASGVAATALDFTDNLPAGVTIANPANEATTCTGGAFTATPGTGTFSYTGGTVGAGAACTVQVDVTSATPGAHVNTSDNLTSSSGDSGTATDTLTVTAAPIQTGTITINKITLGGDGTFNFTGGLGGFGIATSAGTGQRIFRNQAAGTYGVTETLLDGWALTDLRCTDPDNGTGFNLANRTATIDLDPGEEVICTFTNRNVRKQTLDRIRTFLHRRADLLLESAPDRSRLQRRLAASNEAQGTGASFAGGTVTPFNLLVSGDDGAHKLTFSTSLSQIARSTSAAKDSKRREALERAMALGQEGVPGRPATSQNGIDIWVEGHYTGFDDETGQFERNGHLGVLYVGADRVIRPGLLIGVLTQFDWSDDDSTQFGSDVDGNGWMVGPYVSARLRENLLLDLRGAWGESDNDIELIGLSKDEFDTERWLASAKLTGNWQLGNFRFTPSASIKYVEEEQESFVNSLGVFIPEESLTLGRFSFGPELGYRHQAADGTVIEPHLSFTGLWDFDDAGRLATTLADTVASAEDLRGKVEGGVMLTSPGGVTVRATGSYDGIGDDDFEAYSGKLWLNLPLN